MHNLDLSESNRRTGHGFVLIVRAVKFNILVTISVARFRAVANGAAHPIRYRVRKSFSFLTGEW